MKDCWFFDNNFNGLPDETLDDVIEFLDFPLEDVESDGVEQDWDAQFKLLEEPSFGVFSVQSSDLNEDPKPSRSLSTSAKTAEPTYGKTIPIQNVVTSNGKNLHQFQTNSPVSVFESSSSSSVENSNLEFPVFPTKRRRGNRRRLSKISQHFIFTSPVIRKHKRIAVSKSGLETQPAGKFLSMVKKKQRKKDIPLQTNRIEMKRSSSSSQQESVAGRKCMHCEETNTPQWREGPKGPKTLCNACGVRYRSGRLFAEYRPASSPTFVASLHSNSHKKVLELRDRATQESFR